MHHVTVHDKAPLRHPSTETRAAHSYYSPLLRAQRRGRGTPMTNAHPAADASALSWSPACARVGWPVRSCDTRGIRGFTGSPLPAPHMRSGSQHISMARAAPEPARKARGTRYEPLNVRPDHPWARTPGPPRVRVASEPTIRRTVPVAPRDRIRSGWWVNQSHRCWKAGRGDMG